MKMTKTTMVLAPVLLLLGGVIGCTEQDSTPKKSHFEHDHTVAAHWPSDLADVTTKLRERLKDENPDEQVVSEIEDLVSWTAEVAADTDLSEADWLPLYHATESLRDEFRTTGGTLHGEHRKQLESLCQLIDKAVSQIPEQQPYLAKDES